MRFTRAQIESLVGQTVEDHRGNLNGKCPYCGSNEWGISLHKEDHPFNCYRKSKCGISGNIYTLLSFLGKSREFLGERQINVFDQLRSSLQGIDVDMDNIDNILPECTLPVLWKRQFDDPYLRDRGFVDYQFNKYEIGRSKLHKDYVTILVRQQGKVVGYISRSQKSKKEIDSINVVRKQNGEKEYPRYNNSKSDFAKTLFGLDEIIQDRTTDVILVEGPLSKTKTDVNLELDKQENIKCCATFGAKLSEEQLQWLRYKRVKNLVFWFEADVLNKIKPLLAKASSEFNVFAAYLNGKDPNDLNEDQALGLLDKSENWLNFNMSHLSSKLRG